MSLIDDCNELPSMENWLNAGADWSEHHGIIETTTTSGPLFYEPSSTPISLFESKEAVTTHPFLKLDALEICKENPDALLVRTGEERADDYLEASNSPRGPLSPGALQLGKSPRVSSNKRPRDEAWIPPIWDHAQKVPKQSSEFNTPPFAAAMAATAPAFLPPPIAAAAAQPAAILYPTPLTLPNVPTMEEIAQTRPKRRNVRISKDPTSVAARHRRERISDRVRVLQHFVPGGTKMDTASMLDEAIHYVKFLQQQLQILERLGNSYDPRFMAQEDGSVMMGPQQVGNPTRPFDLNRAYYQTFSSSSMAQQQQQMQQSSPTWPNSKMFCTQSFPDSAQEQFCH